jgi:hypothetical protein
MSPLFCQPALQDTPTVTETTPDSSQYSTLPKKRKPSPDTKKKIGYRTQRRVSAWWSLANLKKGPAKRGYRFAASHEERCKFSFTVHLLPDDGTPLANHWILLTHGVDFLTCATHITIQGLILHYYQTT